MFFRMFFSAVCLWLVLINPAFAAKVNVSFPTAATTGALYPLGAGIAQLWNSRIPELNAWVQASNGGVQNLNLLKSGEAQVSFAVSSIAYEALHGQRSFTGRPYENLRVLAGLYYNPNQVVVRADSGIASLTELKGKRFAPGAPGGTTEVETRVHLDAVGLAYPADIKAQFVGFTESVDLMRNRQLDGAWIMAGLPTAAVTEMCAAGNGRLVSIEPELVARINAQYPWYVPFIIPADTYANQPEPVHTSAVKLLLLVDASLPDDLVYAMTRTLWENIPELVQAHPVMRSVTRDLAVTDLADLPLHPGALRYYME